MVYILYIFIINKYESIIFKLQINNTIIILCRYTFYINNNNKYY